MYTEVKETDKKNDEEPYMGQDNENPLYTAAAANNAVLNPIYDRFVFCFFSFFVTFRYLSAMGFDRYDIPRFVLIMLFRMEMLCFGLRQLCSVTCPFIYFSPFRGILVMR